MIIYCFLVFDLKWDPPLYGPLLMWFCSLIWQEGPQWEEDPRAYVQESPCGGPVYEVEDGLVNGHGQTQKTTRCTGLSEGGIDSGWAFFMLLCYTLYRWKKHDHSFLDMLMQAVILMGGIAFMSEVRFYSITWNLFSKYWILLYSNFCILFTFEF